MVMGMEIDKAGQEGVIILELDVLYILKTITALAHGQKSSPLNQNAGIFNPSLAGAIEEMTARNQSGLGMGRYSKQEKRQGG